MKIQKSARKSGLQRLVISASTTQKLSRLAKLRFQSKNIHNLKNGMKNECLLMYLAASIQKSIKPRFGYSNKAVWSKVRKCNICLPIQTDDSGKPVIDAGKTYSPKGYIPDWEYMEKYIKATEKEIIKEVVLYKDEVIAKAKEITGEKEVAW